MLARCENVKHTFYAIYGGSGISVCERWHQFEHFLADMGERPARMSLDRYPNQNGNYEPGNCRWATQREQIRNSKSAKLSMDNVQEVHGRHEHGESEASIARRFGLSPSTVHAILVGRNWPDAKHGYPAH